MCYNANRSGLGHGNPIPPALPVHLWETQGFLGGSVVKNLLARQEAQVQSLDWEDPLEKEIAANSNILAWRILWTEESGGL